MSNTISDVTQDLNGRYTWTITEEDGREAEYRTNRHGSGLFVWSNSLSSPDGEWQQILGTGQFSLSHVSGAKRKIRAALG
jgi:hypothetical protein